jgi:hypothetical protein
VKSQVTLVLTAIATLAAISVTTMMPFGVAFASAEQDNDQYCILSECIQVNQENDDGDNNIDDVTFNDEEEEEEEEEEDAQTLIATPH